MAQKQSVKVADTFVKKRQMEDDVVDIDALSSK